MDPTNVLPYSGNLAVAYALKWSLLRNPSYLDFTQLGGDCTNFVSQCLYAGGHIMNHTPLLGWYYKTSDDRAPAWTSVKFLHKFLTTNTGPGPFGKEVPIDQAMPGDVVQLADEEGNYYHSLLVLSTVPSPTYHQIIVGAHSYDTINRPLASYTFNSVRFIHIEGIYT